VIGGINFTLVTKPYYETHAGGVSMPPAEVIFVYEPVRGLMIALSVLLLTTAMQNRIEVVAVVAGMMLFIVGGLAPLLPQTSLPLYLRVASLWEILGQNFLAGVVCAYLFVEPKRRVRFSSGKERSYVSANR
ncbi:MAG TPA: hypothetical protein VFL29_04615, partial [Candidatus Dormibacteraeota bacterium]|nr:hypothetical protein [Candidatus Dormibacteraeota bacterium]